MFAQGRNRLLCIYVNKCPRGGYSTNDNPYAKIEFDHAHETRMSADACMHEISLIISIINDLSPALQIEPLPKSNLKVDS